MRSILVSCVESVVLSLSSKAAFYHTILYLVRRHSLRYGYTDHPFGSECPNILHRMGRNVTELREEANDGDDGFLISQSPEQPRLTRAATF